jgi:uncharacterized protein (DUF885 family)
VPTDTRRLADRLADRLLAADPLIGTGLGMREYDAYLPDPSAAAEDALAADLEHLQDEADALDPDEPADRTTLAAVRATCEYRRLELENRSTEWDVTAMPLSGPPALFAIAARTTLPDPQAAADYLTRLRAAPGWLDGTTERVREGQAKGRTPVGTLVDQALAWADRTLAQRVPDAFIAPAPPDGWDEARAWRADLESIVADEIMPALARWHAVVADSRPSARSDEMAGVSNIPGGAADYERAVAYHTTLRHSPEEIHRIGAETIDRLTERARELGATLGMADLPAVLAAARASAADADPQEALEAARAAVRRAEERAGQMMPQPLPDPCAVEPMPPTVADSGMAPHYTRPRLDGSRPGTYWFNTRRPTAGTGWDLESVAFHETVPGHHSQLARLQRLPDLPLVQQISLTVHAEGWGLYAERLAGEFDLYSDTRAQIGAIGTELFRAARLVVDTGMHALGWSRDRAIRYMTDHVPLPESFVVNEIDRYLAWPGQALAYMTGQRELLRLRDEARAQLGTGFELPAFNAAVLDSGFLPLPVLADVVHRWISTG